MKFYIYNGDTFCEKCTRKIQSKLDRLKNTRKKVIDTFTGDSGTYPVGPYSDQESDTPQHCGMCHRFLEQPLTQNGREYVKDRHSFRPTSITQKWVDFYGI